MKRTISLVGGRTTYVDEDDFDRLNQHRWRLSSKGYVMTSIIIDGRKLTKYMHIAVLDSFHLSTINRRTSQVDHRDGDKLNNRRYNLRPATNQQNQWHRTKPNSNSLSGIIGVNWYPRTKRWRARIKINGKSHVIGKFLSKEEALKARIAVEMKVCGQFSPIRETL